MATATEALFDGAARTLARRHLSDYLRVLVPEYDGAPHAVLICDYLERLERREFRKLAISTPPQHGKSLHASSGLPAWWLGRRPTDSIIIASYSAELAQRNSRRARGFVMDPRSPFGTRVNPDSAAVGRWNVTDGGGVVAVGTGGSLTGWRGDLLIADDLFAGRAEADSQAVRDSVWSWWRETALTRLRADSAIVCIGTRWHEGDVLGRILESDGADEWVILNLPAISEGDGDLLGRPEGDPLWPSVYGREWLEAQRRDIGERSWAALYQGHPTPSQGAIFLREWLGGRYTSLPDRGLRVVTAVDASFGKSVQSDYSAVVTVASDRKNYYVLHAKRGRWDFATLCEEIKREAAEFNQRGQILVEDAAAGQSAIQELKRTTGLAVVPVKPQGSKLARAESVTPLFESERVFFPENATRWRDELIEELAGFPSAKWDDQTDALVYGLARLRGTLTNLEAPSEHAFGPPTPGGSTWSRMGGGGLGSGRGPGSGWTGRMG